ncbi:MAG: carboxypeptidase-like regulatory domain-containing protein [Actinomycetota bacterium]
MRKIAVPIVALALAAPTVVAAKIDLGCSSTTVTSAIGGIVANADGEPLPGLRVELYQTNRSTPTGDRDTTDEQGRYRICAGTVSGSGHDTYDVHVVDLSEGGPLYATANQSYTTYTNLSDADFTPDSGHPMLRMTNLRITPNDISTTDGPVEVTWTARSKAPPETTMLLSLGHIGGPAVQMEFDGVEGPGPAGGGWNRWIHTETIPANSTENLFWSDLSGIRGGVAITQTDRQPYVIDNSAPLFGLATSAMSECGPGVHANPFSPASPPGTTNTMPIVTHGVCDRYSGGARSGLDPFSLRGRICPQPQATSECQDIHPVLDTQRIVWYPSAPMDPGNYYFHWRIADYAGNVSESPVGSLLKICTESAPRCGQIPSFGALQPGNLGSGNTAGIVVGSSLTSPSSYPYIGFRVVDADGQRDLAPGSLRVRVTYGDDHTLVYDYDPSKGRNEYDAVSKKGGANFDLSGGVFRADGYPLQGKPPGRYVATASITDAGGNNATATWHWVLAAAA